MSNLAEYQLKKIIQEKSSKFQTTDYARFRSSSRTDWPFVLLYWPFVLLYWPFVLLYWPFVLLYWPFVLFYWPFVLLYWRSCCSIDPSCCSIDRSCCSIFSFEKWLFRTKSLKIPKGYSEAVNLRKTKSKIVKWKKTKGWSTKHYTEN
jgi:hypothetical protein